MIAPSFVADLLNRIDIVEIVGRYVRLKKGGANFIGLCPFHQEKSPSFTVSATKQFFHCFGCGAHGSAIGFLIDYAGLSFPEAVKELAQGVGMQVEHEADAYSPEQRSEHKAVSTALTEALSKAAQFYKQQLRGSRRAIDYLKGRGLSGEIALRFGLGFAPDRWDALRGAFADYDAPELVGAGLVVDKEAEAPNESAKRYDRFRDRVMFPIRNQRGDIIGFGGRVIDRGEPKYLNSPETAVFQKGSELYGLYEARQAIRERGYALVVEGYMDVVALAQLGFPNAVATLGTACSSTHVVKLLRQVDHIVFSFDGDAAGRRAAWRALEASLPHAADDKLFSFLFLPAEHDPDSFVRERGAEAFEQEISTALPLSRVLIDHLSSQCDLTTAEGRAKLVHDAVPHIKALPEGMLRLQLIESLARSSGADSSAIAKASGVKMHSANDTGRKRFAAPTRVARAPMDDLEVRILRLLIDSPGSIARLDAGLVKALADSAGPLGTFVRAIENAEPNANFAAIEATLENSEYAAIYRRVGVESLAASTAKTPGPSMSVDEAFSELEAASRKLRLRAVEQATSALAARGIETDGDIDEFRALQALQAQLRLEVRNAP